jgi:hypothetical protein
MRSRSNSAMAARMCIWSLPAAVVASMLSAKLTNATPTLIPVTTAHVADEPHFSQDTRWMAYSTNESGTVEVFVSAVPPSSERWQVSRMATDFSLTFHLTLPNKQRSTSS